MFLKGRALILRLYLPFPSPHSFHQSTVYCTLLFNGLVCWMSALSFYMLRYPAGGAILYSLDHEPKVGDPWGKEVRKLDLHLKRAVILLVH